MGALGKHQGIGPTVNACIDQEARVNDATNKVLPLQVRTAYVVSVSTLKFPANNTKAEYQGPELATIQKLKAVGVSKAARHIEAGAEIKNIVRAVSDYTQSEINIRETLGGPGSDDVCRIAMEYPEFEQPYGFEEQIIEGAGLIIFLSGNGAFNKNGSARDSPSPTCKDDLDESRRHLRHWRHCIVNGPGSA